MRHICVIGAGIIGASVAYQLSKHDDLRVSIVDVGYPGAATTAAGTGIVSPREASDPNYRRFKLLGAQEHLALAEEFSKSPWLTRGGTLQAETEIEDFGRFISELQSGGIDVEVWSAQQVKEELEPNVDLGAPNLRVAYFPSEFTINGAMLTRLLFQKATENGAVAHLGSKVQNATLLDSGEHQLHFSDGTKLRADGVVNAAGANADDIAKAYGISMPMSPQPGIGVHARVEGRPLNRMVWANGVVVKPEADGLLRIRSLLGWGTLQGVTSQVGGFTGGLDRSSFVERVVEQARQILPNITLLQATVTMTGVRPIPADGFPRLGALEAVPGYYEAVTHSGGGLGPLVGRLVAEEIVTGESNELVSEYRPARFENEESSRKLQKQ